MPLDDFTSPGQFGIRLVKQEDQLKLLMEKMLESPPPIVQNWMVGRRETVAVMVEKIWYRAIAVRRIEEQFEVYLLDYGGLVTVAQDMMRPLPAEFAVLPAFNYQVCVAGVAFMVGGRGGGGDEGHYSEQYQEVHTGRGVRWRGAWRKVGSEVDGERRKVESQV